MGTNSRLVFSPPRAGTYTVVATSFSAESVGGYTLRATPYAAPPIASRSIAWGASLGDTLGTDDGRIADRGFAHRYDIELRAGDALEALLTSVNFDAYLILVGPGGERVAEDDDGAMSGTNARIRYVAPVPGTYRLFATTFSEGGTGAYTLMLGQGFDSTSRAERVEAGRLVSARLESGDEQGDGGGLQDRYVFAAETGTQVTATLRSTSFDSFLSVLDPTGYGFAQDDDSAGGLDAQLSFVSTREGDYTFIVTSYDESSGDYTFEVSVAPPSPVVVTALPLGSRREGQLGPGDTRRLVSSGYVDVYTVEATAGQRLDIDVADANVEVQILAPSGELLPVYTFGYGSSLMGVGVPYTGRYTVTVASYDSTPVAYTIEARSAAPTAAGTGQPIALGQVVEGTLGAGDDTALRGSYSDLYLLEITEPTALRVRMVASEDTALDGVLELRDADGVVVASNDDADGLNPILRHYVLPGTYTVVAGQFERAEGAYSLFTEVEEVVVPRVTSISAGDGVSGRISSVSPPTTYRGTPADRYRIELAAGASLTVLMTSEEIDSYLVVTDETGAVVAENDDAGLASGSLDARVSFTAMSTGLYTILAGGYDAREGVYALTVSDELIDGASAAP